MDQESIHRLRQKAGSDLKKIVFPEADDERVLQAVEFIRKEKLAIPILLGVKDLDASKQEVFAKTYFEWRKAKGVTIDQARQVMQDPIFYAAMMLREGLVDGMVAGARYTTAAVMRAVIHCLRINKSTGLVTSCFLMEVPHCRYGEGGTFVFADCGVIPDPTSEQLAKIAILSAAFFKEVMSQTPRVAMLNFSTKGSAEGPLTEKVRKAVELANAANTGYLIDGELQADSAIVPEIARRKLKDSPVAGRANTLIFPNLDSANISYKLTEYLAGARAVGPIILGTVEPCSDLSRGCTSEDVVDVAVITAIRAQSRQQAAQPAA